VAKARNKASAHRESIETELKLAFLPEAASRLADFLAHASAGARTPITAASQHLLRYAYLRTSIGLVIVRQT
jgi:hypothetical protein